MSTAGSVAPGPTEGNVATVTKPADQKKPQTTRKRRAGKPVDPRDIIVRYPNGRTISFFPYRAGGVPAFIEFLQCCAASRSPRWYPQISFRRGEPPTGEIAGAFETVSIAHDANGHPPDWDKVRRWIEERQGHGNFYWPNPAVGQEATTKADKTSILLPVDPDVKVPESVRRLANQLGSPKTNGDAGNESTDTGLAEVAEKLRAKAATKRQQNEQSGVNAAPAKQSEQQPWSNDDGAEEVCHCEVCAGGEKSSVREPRSVT